MVLKINKTKILFGLLTLLFATTVFSMEVPVLKGRVNDYANIINSSTKAELNSYLESIENTNGVQIVVLTVPSLKGEDITSFSIKVADKWQIGQKNKDNGALLVVALQEHDVRIEVGYGLEEKLTDAKCGLIIRNVIIPEFKDGDFSKGILKGIKNMGGIATDNAELVSRSVQEDIDSDSDAFGFLFIIIWVIIIFILINSRTRRFYRRRTTFIPFFFPSNTHHHSSGSFGGFSGGSSFHGGGGHFGGGGASGHW